MKILFKITAHYGYEGRSAKDYFVIAEDSAVAEKQVVDFHKRMDYPSVDFCNSQTIAQAKDYGTPIPLLIA